MDTDILIIGGGASGLMAGFGASRGSGARVTILEKMPRPGRKIMITGKGRCNFTNLKDWNDFQSHIRTKSNFLRPAFYNFPPSEMIAFLQARGLPTVVERGERAFPESHRASDVVDTLKKAVIDAGAELLTDCEVKSVSIDGEKFVATCGDARSWRSERLVIATGGLSYPVTGSTGDGYAWAQAFGHTLKPTFPSLTALVPAGYKLPAPRRTDTSLPKGFDHRDSAGEPELKWHIDRTEALSALGKALCGCSLKNVGVSLAVNGSTVQEEFGDLDFTDGGIEGPLGFELSRACVKALINGGKAEISVDLKPGVDHGELAARVSKLWDEIRKDQRSAKLGGKERFRVLLGKLMPWEIIPGFTAFFPGLLERRGKNEAYLDIKSLVDALTSWPFPIAGYVGYERCVVTAGGVDTDEIFPKTMESRLKKGLYLCGEVLDVDSDTGGYNLQTAFSTGLLAGQSAAKSL